MSASRKSLLSRRAFIARSAAAAAALLGLPGRAEAQSPAPLGDWQKHLLPRSFEEEKTFLPDFTPAQLRYSGGRWREYPTAMSSFLDEREKTHEHRNRRGCAGGGHLLARNFRISFPVYVGALRVRDARLEGDRQSEAPPHIRGVFAHRRRARARGGSLRRRRQGTHAARFFQELPSRRSSASTPCSRVIT